MGGSAKHGVGNGASLQKRVSHCRTRRVDQNKRSVTAETGGSSQTNASAQTRGLARTTSVETNGASLGGETRSVTSLQQRRCKLPAGVFLRLRWRAWEAPMGRVGNANTRQQKCRACAGNRPVQPVIPCRMRIVIQIRRAGSFESCNGKPALSSAAWDGRPPRIRRQGVAQRLFKG
jgi:hypothetical protein